MEKLMDIAIEMANASVENGTGPFGAVVVDADGIILSSAHNMVTANNDPTAHAEVCAIRSACRRLSRFSLEGCTMICSCEPCSMCLSAILWSRMDRIVYANTRHDASDIGFDDSAIYNEVNTPLEYRSIPTTQLGRDKAILTFDRWRERVDRTPY